MVHQQTENRVQSLWLDPQKSDPFVVLKATGEIDLHNLDEFERVVCELLEGAPVVVDLSGLEFFAICALRSLIICQRTAAAKGHQVFYAEPSQQLARLLTLSGLSEVLQVGSPPPTTVAVA